jgi:hypothetical protein
MMSCSTRAARYTVLFYTCTTVYKAGHSMRSGDALPALSLRRRRKTDNDCRGGALLGLYVCCVTGWQHPQQQPGAARSGMTTATVGPVQSLVEGGALDVHGTTLRVANARQAEGEAAVGVALAKLAGLTESPGMPRWTYALPVAFDTPATIVPPHCMLRSDLPWCTGVVNGAGEERSGRVGRCAFVLPTAAHCHNHSRLTLLPPAARLPRGPATYRSPSSFCATRPNSFAACRCTGAAQAGQLDRKATGLALGGQTRG